MKKIILITVVSLLAIVLLGFTFVQVNFATELNKTYLAPQFSIKEEVAKADVELGKRLYYIRNGCVDCHGANLAGVMVMDNGPMGKIYGANITPFAISKWSDEEVAIAIRYGIHKTGRSLRFMPSMDFQGLSLTDVAALIAYLRSVPAVEVPPVENTFGPIAKMLSTFGKMPVMFPAKILDPKVGFSEKPAEAPTKEFGQYLANSCIGCHGTELRGGKIQGGDPSWPEALSIRLGSNQKYNETTFMEAIRSGVSPTTNQKLRAPMPTAQLAQMNEVEIKALWEYLSTLK